MCLIFSLVTHRIKGMGGRDRGRRQIIGVGNGESWPYGGVNLWYTRLFFMLKLGSVSCMHMARLALISKSELERKYNHPIRILSIGIFVL